jgi:hypothetical protein
MFKTPGVVRNLACCLWAEAALNKTMSLRLVGQDRYDSKPSSGRRRNDTSLTSALAFKF